MTEEPIEGVVVNHPIPQHNHVTRDIKPYGQCPACDLYWANAQVHWAFDFGPGGQVYVGKAYTTPTADGTWTLIGYTEEGVKFA